MRVTLHSRFGEFQPDATIELEDDVAKGLLKSQRASLAPNQVIYGHEDEMAPEVRAVAREAYAAAEAAGGVRDQAARAAATAPFRKK